MKPSTVIKSDYVVPQTPQLFADQDRRFETPEIHLAKGPKKISSYYTKQMKNIKEIQDKVDEDDSEYNEDMEENSHVVLNIQKLNNMSTIPESRPAETPLPPPVTASKGKTSDSNVKNVRNALKGLK